MIYCKRIHFYALHILRNSLRVVGARKYDVNENIHYRRRNRTYCQVRKKLMARKHQLGRKCAKVYLCAKIYTFTENAGLPCVSRGVEKKRYIPLADFLS